jgi:glycosyltransferase involved in cell wall biosynthesis
VSPTLRILVVCRRFWPHVDDACHRLLYFCDALRRSGVEVTVLTVRWHSSWPEHAVCRETPIYRLLPAPSSNWNEGYFQKNVVNWIGQHADEFDAIYVDRADGLLAAVASKGAKLRRAVIGRFSQDTFGYGLSRNQLIPLVASAEACRRCTRVIAPTAGLHRLLVSQGIEDRRICRVEDSVWQNISRDADVRSRAAAAMFEVASDFVVPGNTKIVLHCGACELKTLRMGISAVCEMLDFGAPIRMWIVGCELPYDSLYDMLRDRGWHREILLFDGFDDLSELISVADLAIITNPAIALQYTLPLAMHAGLPVAVALTPDGLPMYPEAIGKKLYQSESELADLLSDWLKRSEQWQSDATYLKQWIRRHGAPEKGIGQWIAMLQESVSEYKS